MKIVNIVKILKIFEIKLFLLIRGNIFLEFFLHIRVFSPVGKFRIYNFLMLAIFLPNVPIDFKA